MNCIFSSTHYTINVSKKHTNTIQVISHMYLFSLYHSYLYIYIYICIYLYRYLQLAVLPIEETDIQKWMTNKLKIQCHYESTQVLD